MAIHINIEDLLSARTVETDRIEFKEGWNPDAIYRSVCAFANDFENLGGGYILVGVVENLVTQTAQRPVKGLSTAEIATIQRKMIGFNHLVLPEYHPKLFVEEVDGQQIVVLWVPGGPNRPYQVPEEITSKTKRSAYYIRRYANSVKATLEEQQDLISLANQVPFDDRPNLQAQVDSISMVRLKDYLVKVKSKLAQDVGRLPDVDILNQMELLAGPPEHAFPRNVALMMFAEHPEKYFPVTQVEIVHFPRGEAHPYTEFDPIQGPIPSQIRRTLDFLTTNFLKEQVSKPTHQAESIRTWNYPLQAIEEVLVNAFYHRDYQQREPIEIRIYADSIVITNHGGPDRSISIKAFDSGQVISRRYRNRRLGGFLKELQLTEGRATGIPTILHALKENGSPAPRFCTDDGRTFFEVQLFIHPQFLRKFLQPQDLSQMVWNPTNIDALLEQLLQNADQILTRDIAGDEARDIANLVQNTDNQYTSKQEGASRDVARDIAGDVARDVAGDVAGDVARDVAGDVAGDVAQEIALHMANGLPPKAIPILEECESPTDRKAILERLGFVNNTKNFSAYVAPLLQLQWLAMTQPGKPTTPKQQYVCTLKGRLILELLKHKSK